MLSLSLSWMLLSTLVPPAGPAPDVERLATDTSLASLYAAREKAWRDYFSNSPDLAKTLSADFVGIEAGDTLWDDLAETLAAAKASAARGIKLTALRFPRNRVERYDRVAVIHSRYEAEMEGPDGRTTMKGHITEVFVWDGKQWIHPSWHMDFDGP